jgi:TonB family protein
MFPAIREFLKGFFARVWGKKREEPPLEITAKPVKVKDIWGKNGRRKSSLAISFGIHALALVMLFFVFGGPAVVRTATRELVALISPEEFPPFPAVELKKKEGGGGGGGEKSPLPPSKGRAPRPALRQFTPPSATPPEKARLIMEPTLILPPDIKLPGADLPSFGYPLGRISPPSSGPGSGGGIGTGRGGGVGPGKGPGFGPGEGGGIGGGVYRVGGGVSSPQVIKRIDPDYSDEARKAKFQGTVVLEAIVGTDGNVYEIKVLRPLGLGLDEKAIEAVKKWKFKPGFKNGKPVAVRVTFEVNFRLL